MLILPTTGKAARYIAASHEKLVSLWAIWLPRHACPAQKVRLRDTEVQDACCTQAAGIRACLMTLEELISLFQALPRSGRVGSIAEVQESDQQALDAYFDDEQDLIDAACMLYQSSEQLCIDHGLRHSVNTENTAFFEAYQRVYQLRIALNQQFIRPFVT